MYQVKNKIYADAGNVLKYKNQVAFSFEGIDKKDVLETKINLENIRKIGKFVIYSDELREYISCSEYKDWKKKIIQKQFSNDDQIAIILNKDDSEEDLLLFNKMQEWRVWAGELAKRIINII